MKPFLKWAGGKRQLLSELHRRLPEQLHSLEAFTYIEPFLGGGAMLFSMLERFPNMERIVANDINKDLINAYVVVRDRVEELISSLEKLQVQYDHAKADARAAMFYQKREQYNAPGMTDEVEHAALLIFLNHTCFNGLYRVNSKGKFNVPFGRYLSPLICDAETLRADSQGLQRVEFLCGDFMEVAPHIAVHTFIYLDPPYRPLNQTSAFTTYTQDGFSDNDQRNLANFCRQLSLHKNVNWMLSNSDCSSQNPSDTFFEDIYRGFNIQRVYASRMVSANASKRGKLTELLISSYVTETKHLSDKLCVAL